LHILDIAVDLGKVVCWSRGKKDSWNVLSCCRICNERCSEE
jgi:hypothetical protein